MKFLFVVAGILVMVTAIPILLFFGIAANNTRLAPGCSLIAFLSVHPGQEVEAVASKLGTPVDVSTFGPDPTIWHYNEPTIRLRIENGRVVHVELPETVDNHADTVRVHRRLIGKNKREVRDILGPPAEESSLSPTELWFYSEPVSRSYDHYVLYLEIDRQEQTVLAREVTYNAG